MGFGIGFVGDAVAAAAAAVVVVVIVGGVVVVVVVVVWPSESANKADNLEGSTRQTDKTTNGQTDRQTNRQIVTDRQTNDGVDEVKGKNGFGFKGETLLLL